jgi:hypothetical protein
LWWENPPEGAKNLQGYSIHTETHIPQQGFTRFLRIWSFCTKGRNRSLCSPEQRERRTKGDGLLTEEGRRGTRGRRSPIGDGGRRWREIAGGGEGVARETERTAGGGVSEPLARSRAGGLFLKRDMGAPDSLQCLSGEPPDSAQENRFIARGCRCTGHCTVQCPMHTGLSGEPRQRRVWKILNFSI